MPHDARREYHSNVLTSKRKFFDAIGHGYAYPNRAICFTMVDAQRLRQRGREQLGAETHLAATKETVRFPAALAKAFAQFLLPEDGKRTALYRLLRRSGTNPQPQEPGDARERALGSFAISS